MNALRTIQQEEGEDWVADFLRNDLVDPPEFPFPFPIRKPLKGGYLYLVYQRKVHAYGRIACVTWHSSSYVGTLEQLVKSGDMIVLEGPAKAFPFYLPSRGFTGIRYTQENLHTVPSRTAHRAIPHIQRGGACGVHSRRGQP
jgi:hypothetical protein